ncbi:MAG: SPOR domain-containing protein, partial [Pseudomonadota bacterium]|nr:SPOR domain-containing protein [Pseudomonadota bacterium]
MALGIVFWPLIFDAPDVHDPIALRAMSDKPFVDRTPIPMPESFEAVVKETLPDSPSIEAGVQLAADKNTRTGADAVSLQALRGSDELADTSELTGSGSGDALVDEAGLPIFWVLQVATVGSRDRADELVAALKQRGYRAFSKQYLRVAEQLYRVQIGPKFDRAALMQIKP